MVRPLRRSVVMGLVVLGLAFGGLILVFIVERSNPVIRDGVVVYRTAGLLGDIERGGGAIRLSFQWDRTSMRVPVDDPELVSMLEAARDAGEEVVVQKHLAGAHFDVDNGLPVFLVRFIDYRGKSFGPYEAATPWSWRVLRDEQVALLRAIALFEEGQFDAALADLNRGLATTALRPAQRGLALAYRAQVYELKAAAERAVIGADYLLTRAAEDYDAAFKLRADDHSLPNSRAMVLVRLGATEEALASLDQAMKGSPQEHFKAGVMKAELLRRFKRHDEALAVLDEVGERDRDQVGMMYHYHRGTTLLLLERFPQAAASFADGLKSQKGWPWAYVGRACARHAMGDSEAALTDLRVAVGLADRGARKDEPAEAAQRAELRNNIRAITTSLERGAGPANVTVCQRFQPDFEGPVRERSKLLDAG